MSVVGCWLLVECFARLLYVHSGIVRSSGRSALFESGQNMNGYARLNPFEIQRVLNEDILFNRPLNQRGMKFINSIDDNYPSLNIFAMPLKAMKAQYLLANDSIEKAIEYLELGSKSNPYLMFSESRLGEVYLTLSLFERI